MTELVTDAGRRLYEARFEFKRDHHRKADRHGLHIWGCYSQRDVAELLTVDAIAAVEAEAAGRLAAGDLALMIELRAAYTLLVSAEPTLNRDAARADLTEVQAHFKALLRDRVKTWVDRYRDDFDGGLADLLLAAE